jgi:hypothetical protein
MLLASITLSVQAGLDLRHLLAAYSLFHAAPDHCLQLQNVVAPLASMQPLSSELLLRPTEELQAASRASGTYYYL